jgi:hypothetical protein
MRRLHFLAAVAALALGAGCLSYKTAPLGLTFTGTPPGVSCSTSPPGASVLVNGRATGFYTPCVLDLDEDEWVELSFELPGYLRTRRYLDPENRRLYTLWRDAERGPRTWRWPLWLDAGDFFLPVKFVELHMPPRVHVVLTPESDAGSAGAAQG